MTGDWIPGSTAWGVLVILYSATALHYEVHERQHDKLDAKVKVLLGGEYNISLFVIENDRKPFERAASTPIKVSVAAHHGYGKCRWINQTCYHYFKNYFT